LVGTSDASMLFSPILKETTLPDDSGTGMDGMSSNTPPGTSGLGYSGGKTSPKSKVSSDLTRH
jgi:hypothetical protein